MHFSFGDFSVVYLICGFILHHLVFGEPTLTWDGPTLLLTPRTIQICFVSGWQWRAQIQMPLNFPPILNSFEKKILKVTPLNFASHSSNLCSIFTCCLLYFMGTFPMNTSPTQPKASMAEPEWHMLPQFCPFWETLVKQWLSLSYPSLYRWNIYTLKTYTKFAVSIQL